VKVLWNQRRGLYSLMRKLFLCGKLQASEQYILQEADFEITLTTLAQINVKLMVLQEELVGTCLASNDNSVLIFFHGQ
jgi:hypothetical protein